MATILFIFHPIHAESVASLVGRADALCGLFCCLAMIFYSFSVRKTVNSFFSFLLASSSFGEPKVCYVIMHLIMVYAPLLGISLVCTIAASLSKEIGVTGITFYYIIDIIVIDSIQMLFSFRTSGSIRSSGTHAQYKEFSRGGWIIDFLTLH